MVEAGKNACRPMFLLEASVKVGTTVFVLVVRLCHVATFIGYDGNKSGGREGRGWGFGLHKRIFAHWRRRCVWWGKGDSAVGSHESIWTCQMLFQMSVGQA